LNWVAIVQVFVDGGGGLKENGKGEKI